MGHFKIGASLLILSSVAWGYRVSRGTPNRVSAAQAAPGADLSIATVEVALVNLSSQPQKVAVVLSGEVITTALAVLSPTGLGPAWVNSTSWYISNYSVPSTLRTQASLPSEFPRLNQILPQTTPTAVATTTVPGSGRSNLNFQLACRWRRQGADLCNDPTKGVGPPSDPNDFNYTNNTSLNPKNNYVAASRTSYTYLVDVIVAEDQGAVQASTYATSDLGDATSAQQDRVNFPLNGGRPF